MSSPLWSESAFGVVHKSLKPSHLAALKRVTDHGVPYGDHFGYALSRLKTHGPKGGHFNPKLKHLDEPALRGKINNWKGQSTGATTHTRDLKVDTNLPADERAGWIKTRQNIRANDRRSKFKSV